MAQHTSHASLEYIMFSTAQGGAYLALGWHKGPSD